MYLLPLCQSVYNVGDQTLSAEPLNVELTTMLVHFYVVKIMR